LISPEYAYEHFLAPMATAVNELRSAPARAALMAAYATRLRAMIDVYVGECQNVDAERLLRIGLEALPAPEDREEIERQLAWR